MKPAKKRLGAVISLTVGESLNRNPNNPIIQLIPNGKDSFLWIGNGAKTDMMCFATLAGQGKLRRLARSILAALDLEGE